MNTSGATVLVTVAVVVAATTCTVWIHSAIAGSDQLQQGVPRSLKVTEFSNALNHWLLGSAGNDFQQALIVTDYRLQSTSVADSVPVAYGFP